VLSVRAVPPPESIGGAARETRQNLCHCCNGAGFFTSPMLQKFLDASMPTTASALGRDCNQFPMEISCNTDINDFTIANIFSACVFFV
ncbi:MAG: hypothetical protein RSF79_21130, partial [Janthinobacterium sp.]